MDTKTFKETKKSIWKNAAYFSQKARISKTYLYEIMRGEKMPSIEIGDKLEKASNGFITYIDLVTFYKNNRKNRNLPRAT